MAPASRTISHRLESEGPEPTGYSRQPSEQSKGSDARKVRLRPACVTGPLAFQTHRGAPQGCYGDSNYVLVFRSHLRKPAWPDAHPSFSIANESRTVGEGGRSERSHNPW